MHSLIKNVKGVVIDDGYYTCAPDIQVIEKAHTATFSDRSVAKTGRLFIYGIAINAEVPDKPAVKLKVIKSDDTTEDIGPVRLRTRKKISDNYYIVEYERDTL